MGCGRQRCRDHIRFEGFEFSNKNHDETGGALDRLNCRHPASHGSAGVSMTPAPQSSGSPVSDDFGAPEAPRGVAGFVAAPYATLTGKLSRCLARNVTTKKLVMRNAAPLVSFTFDDAAASACTTGALIVQQHQARGTFYISGGKCGGPSPTGRLATADQVKALHANGHEIGCHTHSHVAVVSIDRAALDGELERNRCVLQDILGNVRLRNFAYPYGAMSFATKRHLGERFDSCRADIPGVNAGTTDLSVLKSYPLEDASIDRKGILGIIAETVQSNGWLIFACHDVDNEPSRYGMRPDVLAFALRSAREAGCELVTIAQALRISRGAAPDPRAA